MTQDAMAAGAVLAETLEAENAALAVLDLPRAASLLDDKQRAVAGLAEARSASMPNDAGLRMARRLQALAAENKRLLERAIAAQGRVIGVVAKAASASVTPSGYGAARAVERPVALALMARA